MSSTHPTEAFVRDTDAPRLAPPARTTGVTGWLIQNLFSSPFNSVLTILFGAILLWLIWDIGEWAILRATWTGEGREACITEGAGACWPFAAAKFPQWIYGFYPIDQRWRVNICFIVGLAALVPMLIPSVPYKFWNAVFLLTVYPLMALILLTGGNFIFSLETYESALAFVLAIGAFLPAVMLGLEDGIEKNRIGMGLGTLALVLWFLSFFWPVLGHVAFAAAVIGCAMAVVPMLSVGQASRGTVVTWAIAGLALLVAMLALDLDFGLIPVETSQWGGLTITLVVSITGIVASLPIGILLALGRRSKMPIVRILSIAYIELWRGVPLVTVLFMSSVMLPLFLPPGVNFDKLVRALIVVAMFSSAYMAEVVRGGLQSIHKGQYEGAMALGLSYWQMMQKIILPQALKVSIPTIVSNFISLFKDTTLVSIIGIFDLLGIMVSSLSDAKWASPHSGPTAYFTAAMIFWIFCFGMSRYSIFTERRLATGHKR